MPNNIGEHVLFKHNISINFNFFFINDIDFIDYINK